MDTNIVKKIAYDAKGQRTKIQYENGTTTTYQYDEFTFRVRRIRTTRHSDSKELQDLHYRYDPVGNITLQKDDAQQTLYFDGTVAAPHNDYTYDALYRLIKVKGRELIGTATFGSEDNWNDAAWQTAHKGDGNAVQNYTQKYTYDAVGNILELRHIADAGAYTRTYNIAVSSNRLLDTEVNTTTYAYAYDIRGNMTEMPHLDAMHWNLNNELHQIANGTMEAFYQYSGGQRIRKYVDKGSIKEERIYLGSFEIYRKFDHTSSLVIERQTVHVSDDAGRIAMLETRTYGDAIDDNDTAEELTRYIYSNHLQSASLELDEEGEIISYEEYHPYGTTSYQAMNAAIHAVAKRYRYTGKERDEESGLYYHGARYYIPWLVRWIAVDPLESKYAGMSPYSYSFNNPVVYNDPSGMEGEEFVKNGVWYVDKHNQLQFATGIKSREEFNKSSYSKKGKYVADAITQLTSEYNYSGYDLGEYSDNKYTHYFYGSGLHRITNTKTGKIIKEYDHKIGQKSTPKPDVKDIEKQVIEKPKEETQESPISTSLWNSFISFLEKGDRFFGPSGPTAKWAYKIGAEYNPIAQAQQNLFSGLLGRDVTIPTWNNINKTGGNIDGSVLSGSRRSILFIKGVSGYISVYRSGLGYGKDFLKDVGTEYVSDFLDNEQNAIETNGNGGLLFKSSRQFFEIYQKADSKPTEAVIDLYKFIIDTGVDEIDKGLQNQ